MQITGKILEISEVVNISETFKKREFIIEYCEREYPEYIKFELTQDRCQLLDTYKSGDNVEVAFNLKGRKWVNPEGETKYFNSLQAWRVQVPTQMSASQYQQATGQPMQYQQAPAQPMQYQQAPAQPMQYQQAPAQPMQASPPVAPSLAFSPPPSTVTDDKEVPF